AYLDAGKVDEALKEWQSITPLLSNGSEIQTQIQTAARKYAESVEAAAEAQKAASTASAKFNAPDDFSKSLDTLTASYAERTKAAESQKAVSDAAYAQRKHDVEAAFQHGRLLFETGHVDEAMKVWQSALPDVENAESLRALLNSTAEAG